MDQGMMGPALPPGFGDTKESHSEPEPKEKSAAPVIGPVLPPGFSGKRSYSSDSSDESSEAEYANVSKGKKSKGSRKQKISGSPVGHGSGSEDSSLDSDSSDDNTDRLKCGPQIGPALPQTLGQTGPSIGPALPPGFKQTAQIGPALPPDLQQSSSQIGPVLPADLQTGIGPSLPPGFGPTAGSSIDQGVEDDDDDYDIVGPMPNTGPEMAYSAAEEIERRAARMKDKLLNPEDKDGDPGVRDSWMTELPETLGKAFGGTTARKFRKRAAPEEGDRSMWTDTPADRERKERGIQPKDKKKKKKHEYNVPSQRDKYMQQQVEEYNKKSKRKESLMKMHEKKLKKKKKKEKDKNKPKERQPFDREKDFQTNMIDDAKRKALIKRASGLGSNFGHGSTQYL